MKVELSIKDDKELRNVIKDMIRGQVKNVIRESVKELIAEEVRKKVTIGELRTHLREFFRNEKQAIRDLVWKAIEDIVDTDINDQITLRALEMVRRMEQGIDERITNHINKIKVNISS